MTEEQTLPGLESAIAKMEKDALSDADVNLLPTYTAERVANFEPERYELAARLLFVENISRRTICKWLHMSPNTLSAIEVRELRKHPERVEKLKEERAAEIEQLKRLGREALRARFFDEIAMMRTSTKDIVSMLKILDEISNNEKPTSGTTNRNTNDNDYIDAISSWQDNGFGEEKNSAPEKSKGLEDAARANDGKSPDIATKEPDNATIEPNGVEKDGTQKDNHSFQQN